MNPFGRVASISLALSCLLGCPEKKPAPELAPAASSPSSAPTVSASAAPSASVAPASSGEPRADEGALTQLRAKYDGPMQELVTEVSARLAAEKKLQDGGSKKFTRIPLPPSKLAKDPNVLQIAITNTKILTIAMRSLNGAPRVAVGRSKTSGSVSGEKTAACPSQYTNEPAADLLYSGSFTMTVTVKTDACQAVFAARDREVARVRAMVEPNVKVYLEHAAKLPLPCETPREVEPAISDELKKLGIRKTRPTCRAPSQSSWQAYGATDYRDTPADTTTQPAWRTTAPGLPQLAFYLSENTATGKPYMLTLAGTRADASEVDVGFFLE